MLETMQCPNCGDKALIQIDDRARRSSKEQEKPFFRYQCSHCNYRLLEIGGKISFEKRKPDARVLLDALLFYAYQDLELNEPRLQRDLNIGELSNEKLEVLRSTKKVLAHLTKLLKQKEKYNRSIEERHVYDVLYCLEALGILEDKHIQQKYWKFTLKLKGTKKEEKLSWLLGQQEQEQEGEWDRRKKVYDLVKEKWDCLHGEPRKTKKFNQEPTPETGKVSPTSYERGSNDSSEATKSTPDSRLNQLEQLRKDSKARCIMRWRAAGVSDDEAEKLADDPSVGVPPSELQLHAGKVILLIGKMGAGKSLIAERLFQSAVTKACKEANAPVPVYLEAWQWQDERPLQKAVEKAANGLGNPKAQGTVVIVDGIDEVGTGLASTLLSEARFLVKAWQETTVVIVSRPMRLFDEARETVVLVSPLSEENAYALIERFAKQPIGLYTVLKWPESLQDAIHLPLFAVLLGIHLREQRTGVPNSIGELLSSLVDRSVGREIANRLSADKLLQQLAIRCIEYRGSPVHAAEVASRAELQPILDSRLVVERYGKIGFPLAILTEWFAAQSLASGNPRPEYLASNAEQLEYWRYPLITAIATFGHDQVSRLLVPIVQSHPAFAAEIVNAGIARRFLDIPLPPWLECGRRLREAMQVWVEGINQPLAKLIAPVQDNGKIRTLGTQTQREELKTGWYYGDEELEDVVQLPLSREWFPPDWSIHIIEPVHRQSTQMNQPNSQPAWAWRFTLDELVVSLSELLQCRALTVSNGFLAHEAIWQAAIAVLAVTGRGSFRYRPIPLNEIEQCFSKLPRNIDQSFGIYERLHRHDLKRLALEVHRLRKAGETVLHPPWPEPEVDCNFLEEWPLQCYGKEQTLAHAEKVYKAAMDGYQQLVKTWFPKFEDRLKTAVILPACFVGVITSRSADGSPCIDWYFEVLHKSEENSVKLRFSEQYVSVNDSLYSALNEKLHSLRPEAAAWIGNTVLHHQGFDVFEPNSATELAYNWLWNDLQQVSWVKGFLGSPPR